MVALRVCVLASGSSGNCIYVGGNDTHVLIDAGISCKATTERLAALGVDRIDAVCVTHAHEDHKSSLGPLQRRLNAGLYANSETVAELEKHAKSTGLSWQRFVTGNAFPIGSLKVDTFSVPHDCKEPVGYLITEGERKVGIVTDLGAPTELIRQRLKPCQVIVLEANHDVDMLRDSDRPWPLKQRIASRHGHLSNHAAGELLCEVAGPHLHTVFLAHLSRDCNRPTLALHTVSEALRKKGLSHVTLRMTYPDHASDVVDV